MMKTQRIRDPIHGMIDFDEQNPLDMAVWDLLQQPELQRLRRIKQLGVSDYVFPSATHTRFAHSVGVFANARPLVQVIKREIRLKRVEATFDDDRAAIALVAAALHDVGHGPFSHAFEEARKTIADRRAGGSGKGKIEKHEIFSANMVRNRASGMGEILERIKVKPDDVGALLEADIPSDMYHSIISSSFDADRLDYLQRDRYSAGVDAGAIDLDWLMDNVRVAEIDLSPAGGDTETGEYRPSFCLLYKAREAAEDFLLARYRLYTNVYFHKTTRGLEQLCSAFFRTIAESIDQGKLIKGIADDSPLVTFFSIDGETLDNYMALDDAVVLATIHEVARRGEGLSQEICRRLLFRDKPFCLDIQTAFPEEPELQRKLKHVLDSKFSNDFGVTVFRDVAKLTLYGEVGADDRRAQKRLMIQLKNNRLREITGFKDSTIVSTTYERPFERYYFLREADRSAAAATVDEIARRG